MIKLFKTLWQRLRFRDKGIVPTPRLLVLCISLALPATLASLWNFGWLLFWGLNIALILVSLVDLWLLPRRSQVACTRLIAPEIERGQPFTAALRITNHANSALNIRVIDSLPQSFFDPFPLSGKLPAAETLEITYSSQATVRGDYRLDKTYVRFRRGLALWEKQFVVAVSSTVKVIPDMSQVRQHLAAAQSFVAEGAKAKHNRVGSGEFAQIRAYVPGDDPRKINWHQTAKLQEIMTNVYEPEHGKYITLLLDCGRPMGVELSQGNRLEKAFEAALTVAAAALQQGDYVSVLAFANDIKAYIPPGKTLAHLRTILTGIYNLPWVPAESDYAKAFLHLETVQKRQGFLLLFSDLDPVLFENAPPLFMQKVSRKHQFVLLGIADPMTAQLLKTEPSDVHHAMLKSTAQKEVLAKKQSIRRWGRLGIQLLEVPEEQLAAQAVSHYMDVINRGVL